MDQIDWQIGQTQQLQEAWRRLSEETAETLTAVQRTAKRQAERFNKRKRRRRQPVSKTPQHTYRVPILEALEQLGGKGHAREVLRIVYEKMKDCLTEDDLKLLPSGGSVRWENTAHWERKRMIENGLLRNDSPVGVWEMTEAGRAYLQRIVRQALGGDEPQLFPDDT